MGSSFFEKLDRDIALHLAKVKAYKERQPNSFEASSVWNACASEFQQRDAQHPVNERHAVG